MEYNGDAERYGVVVFEGNAEAVSLMGRILDGNHDIPNIAGGSEADGYSVRVLPEYVSKAREILGKLATSER